MNDQQKLDYATPGKAARHSPFGIASVGMAITILLFSIATFIWDDPIFQSEGNEKAVRVAMAAGLLGIVLGIRAACDTDRKQTLAITGFWLNVLAIVAALLFLPYI
jgi:small basic protein